MYLFTYCSYISEREGELEEGLKHRRMCKKDFRIRIFSVGLMDQLFLVFSPVIFIYILVKNMFYYI